MLKTIVYHCGIKIILSDKVKLFTDQPFNPDSIVDFIVKSKVYTYPTMSIYKLSKGDKLSSRSDQQSKSDNKVTDKKTSRQTIINQL